MTVTDFTEEGIFQPKLIGKSLLTTSEELASTVGLTTDELQRKSLIGAAKTQRRLRQLVELIARSKDRFGSALIAYAWLRSQPIAGFGDQTAMNLLQQDRAHEVLDYFDAVDAGVHV